MCGIAGIFGSRHSAVVEKMTERLAHRGPDDESVTTVPQFAGSLGHRRLSIIDLAGGHQPIFSEDEKRAIVANGEIYNFKRLRDHLRDRHHFRSASDTESAIHLYEEKGPGAMVDLDGMFAFAIADNGELFMARDPIGIKPLYYGETADGLFFASELKALTGIADEVEEFPPGCWFHSKYGLESYYTLPETRPRPDPVEDQTKQLRRALEEAVGKRLMSEVPLGAFLSGGLDSSILAALARRHFEDFRTFSVGVEGSSDLAAARRVSDHLGTTHYEFRITPRAVREKLPEIIYHLESFDLDLVRSAVPCYFTARLAAEEATVILTGEGADELFAGYDYYRDYRDSSRLHQELRRSVRSLHNINLQRVDRLTMAHSIEARVPFLDLEMIELALRILPERKIRREVGGEVTDKWILRKTFEDLLPGEIVRRGKEQFDQGSGVVDLLQESLDHWMDPDEAPIYAARFPEAKLRSWEECVYHKILRDVFPESEAVLSNVARWSDREGSEGQVRDPS